MPDNAISDFPHIMILTFVSHPASLFSLIVFCVFIYRTWKAIQDGHARTSPNKAVGFFFIPVFHVYWVFQIFWGFAKDCNRFVTRHELDAPCLSRSLYLIFSISAVTFPLMFFLLAFPGTRITSIAWIIAGVMLSKSCSAINALPRLTSESSDIQSSTNYLRTETTA